MTKRCIWFKYKLKAGQYIPRMLCLYEISSHIYGSLMAHLGGIVWSKEVHQPIQLDEQVRTNNSSFYLYMSLLFCGVN